MNPGHYCGLTLEMPDVKTAPLATHALSVCNRCGAPIWTYSTLAGNRVELDNVPGPYILDANDAVFLTTGYERLRGTPGSLLTSCGRPPQRPRKRRRDALALTLDSQAAFGVARTSTMCWILDDQARHRGDRQQQCFARPDQSTDRGRRGRSRRSAGPSDGTNRINAYDRAAAPSRSPEGALCCRPRGRRFVTSTEIRPRVISRRPPLRDVHQKKAPPGRTRGLRTKVATARAPLSRKPY